MRARTTLAACLFTAALPAFAAADIINFVTLPSQISTTINLPGLTLTALNNGITASPRLLNGKGLGVNGGSTTFMHDNVENLRFQFAAPTYNIQLLWDTMNNADADANLGECRIEGFDANNVTLGTIDVTVPNKLLKVNALFGNRPLLAFRVLPQGDQFNWGQLNFGNSSFTLGESVVAEFGAGSTSFAPDWSGWTLQGAFFAGHNGTTIKLQFQDLVAQSKTTWKIVNPTGFEIGQVVLEPPYLQPTLTKSFSLPDNGTYSLLVSRETTDAIHVKVQTSVSIVPKYGTTAVSFGADSSGTAKTLAISAVGGSEFTSTIKPLKGFAGPLVVTLTSPTAQVVDLTNFSEPIKGAGGGGVKLDKVLLAEDGIYQLKIEGFGGVSKLVKYKGRVSLEDKTLPTSITLE